MEQPGPKSQENDQEDQQMVDVAENAQPKQENHVLPAAILPAQNIEKRFLKIFVFEF